MQSLAMHSSAEGRNDQASPETFAGVPLGQLASIAAARAEGFPLEEILDAEGLDVNAYRTADIEYKRQLVDTNERERLAANYAHAFAGAEDRMGRKVSPLDENIEAWVRFLGAYGNQSAPAEWLVTLGLTPPDLSRLSRIWKQRLDEDEGLRKEAEKSARDKKPYDAAPLMISPAKLIPSPFAKSIEKSSLEKTAANTVETPKQVPRWRPQIDAHVNPAPPPSVPPLAPQEVLPFASDVAVADKPSMPEEGPPTNVAPRDALSGTSLSVDIPRGPAMPFANAVIPEKPPFVPKLSLEQHAAMTVEIATYPAHVLAILERYGLTPPEKVDLDRHYQRIVAVDPNKQAAWHAAYGAHYASLMRAYRR